MTCLYDADGGVIGLDYNTEKLNLILTIGLDAATTSLSAASKGEVDPYTKTLYYDRGIVHSVALGYFT